MANIASPTQEFVPVQEVRDGVVVLKDGGLRAVLMVSSLNFALKSEDEQAAILGQFQNFLNSLDFSVQVFIQSRELDIRPYIRVLEERLAAQTDDLMRIQVREYISFIKAFTESTDIMSKNFFVVIPYTPALLQVQKKGLLTGLLGKQDPERQDQGTFEENVTQLEQRVAVVEQGLIRTGVRLRRLETEHAIELLYKMFNPGELEKPIPTK